MKIEDLMTRDVRTCTPADNLNAAANVMWEQDCGAVPVVDEGGRPVGILTDRDVCMTAFFHGATLSDLNVSGVMAKELSTLKAQASIYDALELMREKQIRRVPVVDDRGVLVGMLSLADVAAAWSERLAVDGRELRDDDVALTLSAITRRHGEATKSVLVVEVKPPTRNTDEPVAAALPTRKRKGKRKARGKTLQS